MDQEDDTGGKRAAHVTLPRKASPMAPAGVVNQPAVAHAPAITLPPVAPPTRRPLPPGGKAPALVRAPASGRAMPEGVNILFIDRKSRHAWCVRCRTSGALDLPGGECATAEPRPAAAARIARAVLVFGPGIDAGAVATRIYGAPATTFLFKPQGTYAAQVGVHMVECQSSGSLEDVVASLTPAGSVAYSSGRWRPINDLLQELDAAKVRLDQTAAALSYGMFADAIRGLLAQHSFLTHDFMDWLDEETVLRPAESMHPPPKGQRVPYGTTAKAPQTAGAQGRGVVVEQLPASKPAASKPDTDDKQLASTVPQGILPGNLAHDSKQDVNEWIFDLTGNYEIAEGSTTSAITT